MSYKMFGIWFNGTDILDGKYFRFILDNIEIDFDDSYRIALWKCDESLEFKWADLSKETKMTI